MIANSKKQAQEKMEKTLKALVDELKKVRTGRAQVSMLDNVRVNYYGNMSPLSQVASISTTDPKSLSLIWA
jgi:ribosome recycling factor